MPNTHSLPDDIERCPGYGEGTTDDMWDDCADCRRRTAPVNDQQRAVYMEPPTILALFCPHYIEP